MGRQRLYINDRGDCVINDSGFSWFAGIAFPVWALHRRLYLLAFIMPVPFLAMNFYADEITTSTQILVTVAQFVLSGALANPVHRRLLEEQGWRVTAEEPEQSSGGT